MNSQNANNDSSKNGTDVSAESKLNLAQFGQLPTKNAPSWDFVELKPGVAPDEARAIIEARPAPANLYDPNKTQPSAIKSLATGFSGNTVGGPASIVELARALRNDVDLIYEWVYNNIDMIATYGLQKGGLGALIDGVGSAFDQADLMVKLLRQAGYTANYVFGTLQMDGNATSAWLGTDTNVFSAINYLTGAGVPVALAFNPGPVAEFSHCWVECTIGGTVYTFDPVRKTYSNKSKIDLATAMGYSQATFLSRANSGATITADYVQNMNRGNIRADLDTFSNNLVSWIKSNNFGARLDDILGGRSIIQNDASTPTRQIGHPYLKPGSSTTVWTDIPQAYKATMNVAYQGINVTFNTEDLAGKRLTLFFNASHQGLLRLDGTLVGTSSVQVVGDSKPVTLTMVHPYAVPYYNQAVDHYITTDKPNLICNSWGTAGRGASQIHSRRMKANLAGGALTTDESVLGELMATTWKMWDAMQGRMADMVNRLTNQVTMFHHQCGVLGWYDTPYTNLGAIKASTAALDNNYTPQPYNDTVIAMHGVALEAQIFNQFANMDGVSTTPLVDIAVSAGQKIYDGKSANWAGTVRPALVNYPTLDLNGIESLYINNGYRVGIPENGSITRGSWTGYGYYAIPTFGTFGIIKGALKGGGGSQPNSINDWVNTANTDSNGNSSPVVGDSGYGGGTMPGQSYGQSNINNNTSNDPVDLNTGDFLFERQDLTIGSQGFPYALGFARYYNSSSRYQDGPLGLGWSHNFHMIAQQATDGLMGLGDHSVLAAAASIAELYVAVDVQSDLTKPFSKYVTSALASQWFVDNLVSNTVLLTTGQQSKVFVKLRDATYASPNFESGSLTLSAGNYQFRTVTGTVLNFGATGQIATWVEPGGVTVTFTYSAGKLTTISNGLGRTLSLSYSGNRLVNVSDGTARSVGYTVDGSKNLTVFTDANGKNWTFEYDLPGRMIKYFRPSNPTTPLITNVYDSLERVKEQRDFQSNLWQYYFAAARSQEVNPNGKALTLYSDWTGAVVRKIDQLGFATNYVLDGRSRVTKVLAPEGNSVEYQYDLKDRVVQATLKSKPASGLPDLIRAISYDPTWGRIKTVTDPMSRVTTFNYDPANGNLLSITYPTVAGVGTPTVSMTYNTRGQVLTVTAPDGMVTSSTYHISNETLLSTVVDSGVGRLNLAASYGYDARGNLISVQNPRGNTNSIDYDVLRRPTQWTSPAPFAFVRKAIWDDNGNMTKLEVQTSDLDTPWQIFQWTYTPDDKVLTTTTPQGAQSLNEYDSLRRLWKVTDSLNRQSIRTYDDNNRVLTLTDLSSAVFYTQTYSPNGMVTSVKDARNNITTYSYDGHDRPLKTTYPDSTFEQITSYDGNSNPISIVTRSSTVIALTFDELNREKSKTVGTQPTVTRTFDIVGREIGVSTPVVAGDPSTGTFSKLYDSAGRFTGEVYPSGLTVTHLLDANGNITRTTYPDGYFVERVYDQLDRLTDIKLNGSGSSAIQYQYDALSRKSRITYENGSSKAFAYNIADDISSIQHNFVGSSVAFAYSQDSFGQIVTQRTSDPANYRWMPGSVGTISYGAANNLNQYPSIGSSSFSYNLDGSIISDGILKFEYNSERMMTAVRDAGTNALISQYLYDPTQRQIQKNVGGVKTNYYYAGWQRIADYDGISNTLQQRYVYGTSLDEVLIKISSAGVKTYFHSNHQGSVIAISDNAGVVVAQFKYSPFGEAPTMSGTTHGYTGQRYDSETGLYYYKMRMYSPKLGRFLQPDPLGYSSGLNLYQYASSSPIARTDLLGLWDYYRDTWSFQVWIKPVYFLGVRTVGWHASILAFHSLTYVHEDQSGGYAITNSDVWDFAAGTDEQGMVGQYIGDAGVRDYQEQVYGLDSKGTGKGHSVFTLDQENKEGADTFKQLANGANTFFPEGTQQKYYFLGNELQYGGGLLGSNSNNYIAYLMISMGISPLNSSVGIDFTPGIYSPTNSTNEIPLGSMRYTQVVNSETRTCWKSGRVGG